MNPSHASKRPAPPTLAGVQRPNWTARVKGIRESDETIAADPVTLPELPLPPRPALPSLPLNAPQTRLTIGPDLLLLPLLAAALLGMAWLFIGSRHRVTVTINEHQQTFWTRTNTVRDALKEAGITWQAEDVIQPGLDRPLPADGLVMIRVALPIVISVDGNKFERRTQSTTIDEVLRENNLRLKPTDQVLLNGRSVETSAILSRNLAVAGRPALVAPNLEQPNLTIQRRTSKSFEALAGSGALILPPPYFRAGAPSPVRGEVAVGTPPSHPVVITVDGRTIRTRTHAADVAELLSQQGIKLSGKDYTVPATTAPIRDSLQISITRLREQFITETETIEFDTKWVPDPNLEIDRHTEKPGANGARQRVYKLVYKNGKLLSRTLEKTVVSKAPQDHIFYYGTKIIPRKLTLPDGSVVEYWRKLRLLATSYTPSEGGKAPDDPDYGITRIGLKAGRGIVAVDPRVINLRSTVFVPGYGLGFAGDTGGRIKGQHIDLGYPEGSTELWYRWVEVYVLTPVPPASQINWTLTDYPNEKDNPGEK